MDKSDNQASRGPLLNPADTTWNRFWFGFGQTAEGIKSAVLASLLLFYYSQVLGLAPELAGMALLLATITDGLSDVLIGGWSDRLRHKWGRRHPLMYAAILPFGFSFMALFMPPTGLGQMGLFWWLFVGSLIARNAMTLFVIPHYALGAELSNDHDARTVITAYRQFFGFIGTGLAFGAGVWFFAATEAFPNGQLNPAAYLPYGLALGSLILVSIFTSSIFTHNAIPHLPQADQSDRFSVVGAFGDMWNAMKLPSFAILLTGFFVWVIGLYIFRVGEIYLATYFWRLDPSQVFLLPLMNAGAALVATPIWVYLAKTWGKRTAVILGLGVGIIAYAVFVSSKAVGLLLPAQIYYVQAIFIISFVIAMILAAPQVILGSMVADVADEFELKSGLRREGVMFGAINFMSKLCTGIGAQLTGLIIAFAGLIPRSDPATVSEFISNRLGLGVAVSYLVLTIIAISFFRFYPLTRARHAEIQEKLHTSAEAPSK